MDLCVIWNARLFLLYLHYYYYYAEVIFRPSHKVKHLPLHNRSGCAISNKYLEKNAGYSPQVSCLVLKTICARTQILGATAPLTGSKSFFCR